MKGEAVVLGEKQTYIVSETTHNICKQTCPVDRFSNLKIPRNECIKKWPTSMESMEYSFDDVIKLIYQLFYNVYEF